MRVVGGGPDVGGRGDGAWGSLLEIGDRGLRVRVLIVGKDKGSSPGRTGARRPSDWDDGRRLRLHMKVKRKVHDACEGDRRSSGLACEDSRGSIMPWIVGWRTS